MLRAILICVVMSAPALDASAAPHSIAVEARAQLAMDVQQRRLEVALHARQDLRARLVARGAIPRPPMPALLVEEPGEPPFPGARWTAGTWVWNNGRWEWRAGYWSDPTQFEELGGGEELIGIATGVGVGFDLLDPIRDHRRDERVRDHRDDDAKVRDHRDGRDTQIRDHRREERSTTSTPTVRDHRDDKRQDDDDRSLKIRDHRRR